MARAKSLFPIGVSAVKVLARTAARNAVKRELQAQGVRLSHVPMAEIIARASAYLSDHPELYREALERAQRPVMIEHDPMTMERSHANPATDIAEVFDTTFAMFSGWRLLIAY